jgi:hypothetical protein
VEWPPSHPGRFKPGTHWREGLVGPKPVSTLRQSEIKFACPTRKPITTSAELQKLIIKWQEKWTWEFDEFAGNSVSDRFVYGMNFGMRLSYDLETEKSLYISYVWLWYVLKTATQKSNNDSPRMKCFVWDLTDSAPLKDSKCNQFHKCLLHAVSRSKSSDPNFPTTKSNRCLQINVPEWNSLYGQPSNSSYKHKHNWPLPATNNSQWWCENSRRSFTL